MRLTVIGCSGSYPGPDSPASCYLLEAESEGRVWRVLLDLGNGALGVLHRYVDPLVVDAVLLSHLHADHCLDLCGYYVLRKYHPSGAAPPIPVYGPADTPGRMARAYDLPEDPGMNQEFDFRGYPGDGFSLGPFEFEAFEVEHPVPAYGITVRADGRTLVYSGDTGPCEALDKAAIGADLLLAEASFCEDGENPEDLHLTGRDCGVVAAQGEVGRLVLTHIPPWYDKSIAVEEAQQVFDGPIELAASGARFEI